MLRFSSFTSSSSGGALVAAEADAARAFERVEPPASSPRARSGWRDVLAVCAWTLGFLVLIDVAINVAFRYPDDPKQPPTRTQAYFDYGRSVRGKLARMVGPTDETSGPMALAGWIGAPLHEAQHAAGKQQISVSMYGMSFSGDVARTMAEVDPRFVVSTYGGPSAPPNHSFTLYRDQRMKEDHAEVVGIGILASSVKALASMA